MYVYLSNQKLAVNVYEEFLMEYISVPVDKNTCIIRTYVTVWDFVLLGYDAMLVGDPILTFTGNIVT
jgi:hypothetical protein